MVQRGSTRSAKKIDAAELRRSEPRNTRHQALGSDITPQERERMIAEAAYYRAEARGFDGEATMDDWLQAELEIDERLGMS